MVIQSNLYSNNLGLPLSGSQDFVGLAPSCLNTSQQHQHQQQQNMFVDNNFNTSQQHQHQQQQNMFVNNNSNLFFPSSSSSSMAASQALALQFQRQSWEIDQYLRLQNENLRVMVEEQRKQQVATMLEIAESKGIQLLRQKDEEIAQATKKKMELEQFLTRMEQENEAWKKVAQEKEAMVLSLRNTIEKVKERRRAIDDAGSCCNEKKDKEEEEEEKIVGFDDDEVEVELGLGKKKKMKISSEKMGLCKRCDFGKASVLFLPCRHLCSCKDCEALLQDCPICGMPKKASIETRIF